MTKNAVVLISGGADSATTLAIAQSQGFKCYAISFDYGQKHNAELNAAREIARSAAVESHEIIDIKDLSKICKSALTTKNIEVPTYKGDDNIPSTYVPARNTIFLSIAMGWAESIKAYDIFIGATEVDYSGYPDCRGDYFTSFQAMMSIANKTGIEGKPIKINTPLLRSTKKEVFSLGQQLGVDYSKTVTCYSADDEGRACGKCDSCHLRRQGFKEAGIIDPTRYI